jgi:hypothetical protein
VDAKRISVYPIHTNTFTAQQSFCDCIKQGLIPLAERAPEIIESTSHDHSVTFEVFLSLAPQLIILEITTLVSRTSTPGSFFALEPFSEIPPIVSSNAELAGNIIYLLEVTLSLENELAESFYAPDSVVN